MLSDQGEARLSIVIEGELIEGQGRVASGTGFFLKLPFVDVNMT